MKKIIIALFAVLGVATSVSAQKFGHVDTQAIMQSLPEVTKANGELQATAQQYENELKTMQDEIQRKAEEYDKQKATMNATQQQAAEQDLQTLYNKLQEAYQQNQQNIQKKQDGINALADAFIGICAEGEEKNRDLIKEIAESPGQNTLQFPGIEGTDNQVAADVACLAGACLKELDITDQR